MDATNFKTKDLEQLFRRLEVDIDADAIRVEEILYILSKIKVYGRDPVGSEPIYSRHGIEILGKHAFKISIDEPTNVEVSREALRCLANALLLNEGTRQIFVDLNLAEEAASRLKADDSDDEFLLSRLLLLTTYAKVKPDFKELNERQNLIESLTKCLSRHAALYDQNGPSSQEPSTMDVMALTETCKLIFNVTHFQPSLVPKLEIAAWSIMDILSQLPLPRPVLQPPLSSAINCLINLDINFKGSPFYSASSEVTDVPVVNRLIEILNLMTKQYKDEDLENAGAPLITLIRKIYPQMPKTLRTTFEAALLPSSEERDKPLGQSDTLAARLLKLTTSALAPTLRTSIAAMLYELSDSDPAKFTQNVGYGYASGFLMSQGIPVPANATSQQQSNAGINPVTGQRRDAEPEDDEPPMTNEEKEREAERLFVLFERLRATGVVDVQNPVRQAMEEGRFEELPD